MSTVTKMTPRVKKLWVEALRSGKYKQGRGCLRPEEKFCCLGVLSDLHCLEFGGKWDVVGAVPAAYCRASGGCSSVVEEWAGTDFNVVVDIEGKTTSLAAHNDADKTFAQIADAIEEQL